MGVFIVVVTYGLRGHDILTALFITLLFLTVVAKVIGAVLAHRSHRRPPGRGGSGPAGRTFPRPPAGRPPVLVAAEQKPIG